MQSCSFDAYLPHRDLHPFPTRRSSDLLSNGGAFASDGFVAKYSSAGSAVWAQSFGGASSDAGNAVAVDSLGYPTVTGDRKSTRLNSSHRCISYAVFCLKKKNDSCQ